MDENVDVNDIFRHDKVQKAISGVFELLGDEELTVVESIHVIRSVNAALRGEYPGAYAIFEQIQAQE